MRLKTSIVIISSTEQEATPSLLSIEAFSKTNIFEVILVTGNNPSAQRNEGARLASGDYVLFLDNDSVCPTDLLERYEKSINEAKEVNVIGGPSILKASSDEKFQSIIDKLFNNFFVIGPVRSRYDQIGNLRRTNEKEIILCNLMVKKIFFTHFKGFDERIYPNEENDFLNRCKASPDIWYAPDAYVYRQHRKNIPELVIQMIRYGNGRAKSIVNSPSLSQAVFLLPALIWPYLILLICLSTNDRFWLLAIYTALLTLNAILCAIYTLSITNLLAFIFITPIIHMSYGTGLIIGLVNKLHTPKSLHLKGIIKTPFQKKELN